MFRPKIGSLVGLYYFFSAVILMNLCEITFFINATHKLYKKIKMINRKEIIPIVAVTRR